MNLLPVALGLTIRLTNKSGAWATPMRRFLQQRYLAKKNQGALPGGVSAKASVAARLLR